MNRVPTLSAMALFTLLVPAWLRHQQTRQQEPAPTIRRAIFAAGCFWGIEAAFRHVDGVVSTVVGYTGGHLADPTYRLVSLQSSGHAEAVLVTYDSRRVSYEELLDVFWNCHDPTIDHGAGSHRSAIFCFDAEQESAARRSINEFCQHSVIFTGPLRTQILPATRFYAAEDEHQHYFEKWGDGTSCHKPQHRPIHTRPADEAARARREMTRQ